jgi:squalene synthase HpnC
VPSTPYPAAAAAPTHYENFPVASWLCPPRLRPPIAAIYAFARTADDIADEGVAAAAQRLEDLHAFRAELAAAARGAAPSPRWPEVFGPLAKAMRDFALPESLLADLLSAFMQDIEKTRDAAGYADRAELLDYCRRSANPIGRLLLHLYGVDDARALARSDAICSALQLINFWQDLSVDLPRGRHYLPAAEVAAHGLAAEDFRGFRPLAPAAPPPSALALVSAQVAWARDLMNQGAPLVHRLPGRAGWELRLVVQGGLRILDKIEALGFDTWSQRPTIGKADAPLLAWRALRMRRQSPAMTSFPR